MKISTRGRYGIKAMVDLAIHSSDGKCVPIKNIAKRQGIPENYLEQLMAILKREGIVKSIRGTYGGYILSKPPADISVGDLIKVLEGNLAIVDCVEALPPKKKCGNADCSQCNVREALTLISDKFTQTAHSISLKDLINNSN